MDGVLALKRAGAAECPTVSGQAHAEISRSTLVGACDCCAPATEQEVGQEVAKPSKRGGKGPAAPAGSGHCAYPCAPWSLAGVTAPFVRQSMPVASACLTNSSEKRSNGAALRECSASSASSAPGSMSFTGTPSVRRRPVGSADAAKGKARVSASIMVLLLRQTTNSLR